MKAHLTWDQQIQLLRANGLQINDENSAFTLLSTYGYFRLRGYFHVFLESQEDDHSKKSSKFLGGSDINQIADLMEFDQKLRVLLFDALSQFEIALRTKFSYFGGEIDPQLHVTGIGLHLPASKSKSNADHLRWLEKYNDKLPRHRAEPFVLWHIQNYEGNMPIWVAVEIFDFGDISKLLRLSSQKLASNIANEFGTQPSMFKSWVASLNELRNAVVHQNRLWNRTFTYSTGKKLSNLPSSLKHLSSAELDARLMYTRLAILVSIDEASSLKINFKARLMELFQSFPENEFVTIEQMGFPEGWKEFPLWQG